MGEINYKRMVREGYYKLSRKQEEKFNPNMYLAEWEKSTHKNKLSIEQLIHIYHAPAFLFEYRRRQEDPWRPINKLKADAIPLAILLGAVIMGIMGILGLSNSSPSDIFRKSSQIGIERRVENNEGGFHFFQTDPYKGVVPYDPYSGPYKNPPQMPFGQ